MVKSNVGWRIFRNKDIIFFFLNFYYWLEKDVDIQKLNYSSRFSSVQFTILLQIRFLIALHEYQLSLQSTTIQNDVPYISAIDKNGVDFAFYKGQSWCCTYEDPKKLFLLIEGEDIPNLDDFYREKRIISIYTKNTCCIRVISKNIWKNLFLTSNLAKTQPKRDNWP